MLPIKDLNYKILNQLDDRPLVNYCSTNKEAHELCMNNNFWRDRFITKFPYFEVLLSFQQRFENTFGNIEIFLITFITFVYVCK